MKNLMLVLVLLVSGIGFGQKPTDSIPEHNINLELFNQCVVDAVNVERKKRGLKPFIVTDGAMEFSKEHTEWMVETGKFEHSKNDTYGEVCNKLGFFDGNTYEEASKRIVESWMDSPLHREVLMDSDYTECGTHTIYRFETTEWEGFTNRKWYSTSSFTLRMYN